MYLDRNNPIISNESDMRKELLIKFISFISFASLTFYILTSTKVGKSKFFLFPEGSIRFLLMPGKLNSLFVPG